MEPNVDTYQLHAAATVLTGKQLPGLPAWEIGLHIAARIKTFCFVRNRTPVVTTVATHVQGVKTTADLSLVVICVLNAMPSRRTRNQGFRCIYS